LEQDFVLELALFSVSSILLLSKEVSIVVLDFFDIIETSSCFDFFKDILLECLIKL
jgi:hypothetical protein